MPYFGQQITKFSVKAESRNNAVVVQDLATQWTQSYPCKKKKDFRTEKSSRRFMEPSEKPEVIYTGNSPEFGKFFEGLTWKHSTSTPRPSETDGISERAVRRVKEGTSALLLQSGLDNEWWADSMECCCYLRNIQDLLYDEKTPYERRFGEPFDGPVIPFGSMIKYHHILLKTSQDSTSLVKWPFWASSLDMCRVRGISGKETLWSQALKNWRRWTHQKSTPEGSMQIKC